MQWKPIPDFDNYEVSDQGQVRNVQTGRILALSANQQGVVHVGLMASGGQYRRSLPLLVADAYVKRPRGPFDTPINLNGDRFDCRAVNLQWRPRWYAVAYNRQFIHPYENPITQPLKDNATGVEYPNSSIVAETFGLLEVDIVLAVLNHTFVWPTYQVFSLV